MWNVFIHWSQVVLKTLNWGLAPMTPNSWVKVYLQLNEAALVVGADRSNPPDNEPGPRSNLSENEDFILSNFSPDHFSKIMQLLDLCILDMGLDL